jgi:hypothetical protein
MLVNSMAWKTEVLMSNALAVNKDNLNERACVV